MAEEQPTPSQPAAQESAPPVVNLQIVSPSVGVGSLRFPDLPATTTVQQLKARIRETLASRPADDNQRLIHRGRLLARETDTLQDVLGEEAIRTGDQQTIHLVVRDTSTHPAPGSSSAQPTPAVSQSSAVGYGPPRPDAHMHHPLYRHNHPAHVVRNAQPGASFPAMPRPGPATMGMPQATPNFAQHHQPHQDLVQRMNELLARQQVVRDPARDATRETRHDTQGQHPADAGGRNSPIRQPPQTFIHEGPGPDGQQYSVRIMVNEVIARPTVVPRPPAPAAATSDPVGHRPLSAADFRNIMHGADATRAAQTMTNAMHRNVSGVPPANMAGDLGNLNFNAPVHPIPPGVTTPIFPGLSRNASRTATPDPAVGSASQGSGILPGLVRPQSQSHIQPSQGQPDVYILYSPTGPRALLINSTSEIYTTPMAYPPHWVPNHYRPPPLHALPVQIHMPQPGPERIAIHVPPAAGQAHTGARQQSAPVVQQQPLPQAHNNQPPIVRPQPPAAPAGPALAPRANHPGNPGAAALGAALWPHIWLLIRLGAFAWWFSYSNPSWERWLSLLLAFVVVFAVNTGLFTGIVNDAFNPVREQLEGMIPFADPERQRQQQEQQQNRGVAGAHQNGEDRAEPDPAQVAARLVAERRIANGNWLAEQLRRAERAGILFLASFAPGVAERHIQQLEERERAERRAAEEARVAAERAAQEAPGNQQGQEGRQGGETVAEEGQPRDLPPRPPPVEA